MKTLLKFFSSKKNEHSMMRLIIFILSLPIIFNIIYYSIKGFTIDWSGIAVYSGILLGGKVGQKFVENKQNKIEEDELN